MRLAAILMGYDAFADPCLYNGEDAPFQVCVTRGAGGALAVRIIGGLDICTATRFDGDMATMLEVVSDARRVEVDVTDLTFLDTVGLTALNDACVAFGAGGAQVALVGTRPQIRRILQLAAESCWLSAEPIVAVAREWTEPPPRHAGSSPAENSLSGTVPSNAVRVDADSAVLSSALDGAPARDGRQLGNPIVTRDLLTAVAQLGESWPARFGRYEICEVRRAVDRERLAGNLLDSCTLSPQGRQLLTLPLADLSA